MALGDKKYVGLVDDWGQPNSPATLDKNGKLTPTQWPALDDLGAADRVLSNLTDPAQAIYNLGAKPGLQLLRNGYFADPVNQRGQETYDGSGYGIDGWRSGAISVVKGEGIKSTYASSIIVQSLEPALKTALHGKVCTISVLCDGVLNTAKFTYNEAPASNVLIMYGGNMNASILTGGSVHIAYRSAGSIAKAAFLELGDHQTHFRQDADGNWVLNDPPPDKGLELLRCITSTADPNDTYANKVIATKSDLANYLPLTGGTLTGNTLGLLSGKGKLCGFGSNTSIQSLSVAGDSTNLRWLAIWNAAANGRSGIANAVSLGDMVNGELVEYLVLHTGNKPNGSYTGNGDATERVIETGGIGNALIITSNLGSALVTKSNAILFSGSDGVEATVAANFSDGVLTISSAHKRLNYASTVYSYQVL